MTSENQISKAREIAQDLQDAIRQDCKVNVDDWSNYGSFRIFITLPVIQNYSQIFFKEGISLRSITWTIKRVMRKHKSFSEIEFVEMPKQSYDCWKNSYGYNYPYIKIDLRIISS